MANNYIYRAEPIGALVPPETGIETPTAEQLDGWTLKALQMQRGAGIALATDGEYRRHNLPTALARRGATGEAPRLVEDEAAFAVANSKTPVKVSLPTPSSALEALRKAAAKSGTAFDEEETGAALSKALAAEIEALFAAGVTVVQLNGAAYGDLLKDEAAHAAKIKALAALDAALLSAAQRPAPANKLGLRIGRPGPAPSWAMTPALKTLLALPADRLLLDLGSQIQDFGFLKETPDSATIVLGLLETAKDVKQSDDDVLSQIDKAVEAVDGERLALSPRGGFQASAGLTWDDQRKGLERLAIIATQFWGFAM